MYIHIHIYIYVYTYTHIHTHITPSTMLYYNMINKLCHNVTLGWRFYRAVGL